MFQIRLLYKNGGMKMAEHTKGARGSTWDKHTSRDKGLKQGKIKDNPGWVDHGKRTNSERNQERKRENLKKYN